jgi:hypothetical protein
MSLPAQKHGFTAPALILAVSALLCLYSVPTRCDQTNTVPAQDPAAVLSSRNEEGRTPELVKTKPYRVADIIRIARGGIDNTITNDRILEVQVTPIDDAKGFAYFDGRTTWKLRFNLDRPEDLDNDPEENCWKVIGGMSEKEKFSESDAMDEGGASPGRSGTGDIDIKVFYRNNWGGVAAETIRARVVLKRLIVEVDWMEGSFQWAGHGGERREIGFKPTINQEFIDAFGQAGIEVIVADTPESGNLHNIIREGARYGRNFVLNRQNLVDLVPEKYRDCQGDVKAFNNGLSCIARRMIDLGYMDFDASRTDVIYVVGAQRWASLPGAELQQTRGATALFEHKGSRYNVAFVFNRAIAESIAAVNRQQETRIPWEVGSLHTALHECAAHCFPLRWKNEDTSIFQDPYWRGWRYQFVGHPRRNESHEYGKIHKTNVACAESTLDAAYYTWMKTPRLSDFSNRIGNSVDDKCRDIIRDFAVERAAKRYGCPDGVSDATSTRRTALRVR